MRILFSDITTVAEDGVSKEHQYVLVEDKYIKSISDEKPEGSFDRVICGKDRILMPALYNCHAHAAMTLFRGYGEDMPLQKWLFDRIFPAEDLLTERAVYDGSMLACLEMIRNGIVSFTDMYFFNAQTIKAVMETGMKANIGRCLQSFDPSVTKETDARYAEAVALHKEWHNAADGRIKMDMSLHAEYTIQPQVCVYAAEYAKEHDLGMHIHLSETESEHREGMERRGGKTPARFFYDLGVFDVRTTAAHCVWVTDEDMDIMREKGVYAAHNPTSNLKLGSGIMRTQRMHEKGVNIVLGTDGAASNNRLDIFREMNLAAILQKGSDRVCDSMSAADFLPMATVNGARSQGREDCGRLAEGYRADLILVDMDAINNIPCYAPLNAVMYSATGSDVRMTMADGVILYENGVFTTVDVEAVKYRMRETVGGYFDQK